MRGRQACMPCSAIPSEGVELGPVSAGQAGCAASEDVSPGLVLPGPRLSPWFVTCFHARWPPPVPTSRPAALRASSNARSLLSIPTTTGPAKARPRRIVEGLAGRQSKPPSPARSRIIARPRAGPGHARAPCRTPCSPTVRRPTTRLDLGSCEGLRRRFELADVSRGRAFGACRGARHATPPRARDWRVSTMCTTVPAARRSRGRLQAPPPGPR